VDRAARCRRPLTRIGRISPAVLAPPDIALGTDHVDLHQIHRFDPNTPFEETLEALHDVVKAGKALYIGASSMYAWQFARALHLSERHGWTRFVSMQNYVNLLYREEEREMLPLCRAEGIAVMPWSPMARGRLTRDWEQGSARAETDAFVRSLYAKTGYADRKAVEAVAALSLRLSPEECATLEAPYVPHAVVGHA
jgi:aryl-alcohol dehydrogenase-like predicted oxidoreductase